MDDKLKQEMAEVIEAIFAEKKEVDMRKKTESALVDAASEVEALQKDIDLKESELEKASEELKALKDSNKEEVATVESKLTELEEKLTELKEKADSADSEAEKASVEKDAEIEALKSELDAIKKEAVASNRIKVLEEAGVHREDSDAQKAKIIDMSDEEFDSYKDELVEIRASIIKKIGDVKLKDSASLNFEADSGDVDEYAELGKALASTIKKD